MCFSLGARVAHGLVLGGQHGLQVVGGGVFGIAPSAAAEAEAARAQADLGRIRTLYDSLLVVPNAKLADTVVNNMGARRRRSLSATVIVTSGATPERMEAFTKAVRQRIADDPIFEDKYAEVNIVRFWTEGIDVEISTMVETRSGRASREATHKLYIDIMQIAKANGLGLAHATDTSAAVAAEPDPQRS